jgi:integrase/recombinase XerD
MNTQASLAPLFESFFRDRLAQQRNATPATIASYRDALRMLVLFASERSGHKPSALRLRDLDRDVVLGYLDHLERGRRNCIHTRNSRLTAVRSFFHHVAANDPAALGVAQRVLTIPAKRSNSEVMPYLSRDELTALIETPDQRTARGRRDRTLLLFLARTGARISEALDVEAFDLDIGRPMPQVRLRGKGRKERMVPLSDDLVKALSALMREHGIGRHEHRPLFVGVHGQPLTRFGATHIVRRAVAVASAKMPALKRKRISPHVLRHSLAMMLLQSGVDLLTIQAWLGHAQVATTHRYATADVEMMRRGLDKAGVPGRQPARFQPKDAVLRLLERA